MTTNNHTPITVGAAANASTFNNPMGELDAAIGNKATLVTTAKTTLVAAVNEVAGEVQTARGGTASLNTRLGNMTTATTTVTNEVVGAREGQASLDLRLDAMTTATGNVASEVSNARGGMIDLGTRLDAIEAGGVFNKSSAKKFMRSWRAQMAKLANGATDQAAVLALIGDYNVSDGDLVNYLRTALQTKHGDGGIGWVSFAKDNQNAAVTVNRTGTWTVTEGTDTASADLSNIKSNDAATPAKVTVVADGGTQWVLYYLGASEVGSFRYRVDGGGWVTVTPALPAGVKSVDISVSDAEHTLEVEILTAFGGGVTLYGCDLQHDYGARVHNLGCATGGAQKFSQMAAASNVMLSNFGTNAIAVVLGHTDIASLRADVEDWLEAIATSLTTGTSHPDTIMVIPTAMNDAHWVDLAEAIRGVITASDAVAMLDADESFGAYAELDAFDMVEAASNHLNADGYRALSDLMCDQLLRTGL